MFWDKEIGIDVTKLSFSKRVQLTVGDTSLQKRAKLTPVKLVFLPNKNIRALHQNHTRYKYCWLIKVMVAETSYPKRVKLTNLKIS